MFKIKVNDIVQAVKGRDKGKKGKVLSILGGGNRALVEGINLLKKHKRKTQQDQQGGIISIESGISIANIKLVCKHCSKPVRVGIMTLKDGTKSRYCKACKEAI
jgi:large subunit ribosomal protein L24